MLPFCYISSSPTDGDSLLLLKSYPSYCPWGGCSSPIPVAGISSAFQNTTPPPSSPILRGSNRRVKPEQPLSTSASTCQIISDIIFFLGGGEWSRFCQQLGCSAPSLLCLACFSRQETEQSSPRSTFCHRDVTNTSITCGGEGNDVISKAAED